MTWPKPCAEIKVGNVSEGKCVVCGKAHRIDTKKKLIASVRWYLPCERHWLWVHWPVCANQVDWWRGVPTEAQLRFTNGSHQKLCCGRGS